MKSRLPIGWLRMASETAKHRSLRIVLFATALLTVRELCDRHNHSVDPKVFAMNSPIESKRNPRDGLIYVRIPPGVFTMGCSPEDSECFGWEPSPHQVRIDRAFWIGQTEVTQKAYS